MIWNLKTLRKILDVSIREGKSISVLLREHKIEQDEWMDVFGALHKLISGLGPGVAKRVFARNLADHDPSVRGYTVMFLGKSQARWAESRICGLATDKDEWVRERVADALEHLRSRQAVSTLISLSRDGNWFVRDQAAESLGGLRARSAVSGLLPLLRDREWVVRCTVAEALGEIGSKGAIPALQKSLRDRNAIVRGYVATALAQLGDNSSRSIFEKMAGSEHPRDRLTGAAALYVLGDHRRLADVAAFLSDRDLHGAAMNDLVWMVCYEDIAEAKRYLNKAIRAGGKWYVLRDLRDAVKKLDEYVKHGP